MGHDNILHPNSLTRDEKNELILLKDNMTLNYRPLPPTSSQHPALKSRQGEGSLRGTRHISVHAGHLHPNMDRCSLAWQWGHSRGPHPW